MNNVEYSNVFDMPRQRYTIENTLAINSEMIED